MKSLIVNKIKPIEGSHTYFSLQQQLKDLHWHFIDECNWPEEFPYTPRCEFQIAHTATQIVLHYKVKEEYVRALAIRHNEDIWKDSCVEFFISLDEKKTYYNFEFNAVGAGIIGYGTAEKSNRARLNSEIIDQVDVFSAIQGKIENKEWGIILVIPIEIMELNEISGKRMHANFYKCGDDLPQAHYISWNSIKNETPNFHLPEYFGEIEFE